MENVDKPELTRFLKFLAKSLGWLVRNRNCVVVFSIMLLVIGYLIDGMIQNSIFLSGFAALVAFLGLVLTIKNHYLKSLKSIGDLYDGHYEGEPQCSPTRDKFLEREDVRVDLINKATDEGVGIILVLVGSVFSAFGSLIPLIDMCGK